MEKYDVARKVLRLETLADNAGASEHERSAAKAKALSLREQYEVTDDDVDRCEPFFFMGSDVFFWSREIEPLIVQAGALLEKAIARADKAGPNDQLETYIKLHQVLKHAAEETGWPQSHGLRLKLKSRRNALIKEAYKRKVEETYQISLNVHREVYGSDVEEADKPRVREEAAERAAFYLSLDTGLRRDVIDRLVGRR